ncbi:MAG: hypothetical protein AVDCRST_MAG77-5636 [uncultured Chloroflexi bacterium]|uniref:Glycosyltransferase RgtA/B/C/D-like domain-containing protein n=1 Tax=uncultured Chloroflexota bacterium TaxID=166587 RepID=A0A6J4K6B3_9CHLR|nr:MAG: hypothetical protein AVDCRST_MAG77-5636 [uncultured Chloroflexota bacterium]
MTAVPRLVPALVLAAMMLAYSLTAGSLALRRHWNLESQALDMGYADQVTWNMTQGRFFRFTVFRGPVGAENGRPLQFGPGADRDSLLAFHTELLFLPLSALYFIRPGVETLIVFLTAAIALGALPAYLLAHRLLGHAVAGLAIAAAYLLSPSLQAANLSDFHLVSTASTFLLFAAYFVVSRRDRAFVVTAVLSALLKEEVALFVGALGVYAWLIQGRARFGMCIMAASLAWVAVCLLAIIPRFSGGAPSLFAARYADSISHLRTLPASWLSGRPVWPVPGFTLTYVRELLASTGFVGVVAPIELALAAPALAINGLSSSPWQHGGGAHYSAEAVAGLIFGAVAGIRRLSGWGRSVAGLPTQRLSLVLSAVVFSAALFQARAHGLLPPAARFSWPQDNGRLAALQPLLARVPPRASLSAQSNIFPHVSNRERIYVFPAVEDAEFVLIDMVGTSDPLYPDELFTEASVLLSSSRFRLLDSAAGFLLLERSQAVSGVTSRPQPSEAFLSFTHAAPTERWHPATARFDDLFEVVAYGAPLVPEVSFVGRRVLPVFYVRALRPIDRAYRFTTFRVGPDGLARIHDDGTPTQLWRPTYRWQPGEVVKLQYPPMTYATGERLGVGVQVGAEVDVPRLAAISQTLPLADHDRVAILGRLP